ncbi:hypothetical protein HDU96_002305 [Phlyctochytrium bullatum]|nr:hypothetical protein HDU96_002305 [Phlyctochytrium bullatum]
MAKKKTKRTKNGSNNGHSSHSEGSAASESPSATATLSTVSHAAVVSAPLQNVVPTNGSKNIALTHATKLVKQVPAKSAAAPTVSNISANAGKPASWIPSVESGVKNGVGGATDSKLDAPVSAAAATEKVIQKRRSIIPTPVSTAAAASTSHTAEEVSMLADRDAAAASTQASEAAPEIAVAAESECVETRAAPVDVAETSISSGVLSDTSDTSCAAKADIGETVTAVPTDESKPDKLAPYDISAEEPVSSEVEVKVVASVEVAANVDDVDAIIESQQSTQFEAVSVAQDLAAVATTFVEVTNEIMAAKSSESECEPQAEPAKPAPSSTVWRLTKNAVHFAQPVIAIAHSSIVAPATRLFHNLPYSLRTIIKASAMMAAAPAFAAFLAFCWPLILAYRLGPMRFRERLHESLRMISLELHAAAFGRPIATATAA